MPSRMCSYLIMLKVRMMWRHSMVWYLQRWREHTKVLSSLRILSSSFDRKTPLTAMILGLCKEKSANTVLAAERAQEIISALKK